ncbi:jg14599 [Pararge aegeria aegeria]|uniref:Jg14599 protein n=1 Tax=Pararge aegeria aegeria TaxID=348720 RepID=A0A8S4QYF0_9NEOP|nr:jg14599 [Pararge aegeria aegeria]
MQWAGHVQRMEGTRAPKRLIEVILEVRRGRGVGGVMELRGIVLGVRSWKEAASDRLKWRNMLEQAEAHPGL